MNKSPDQFTPGENDKERIDEPGLAEGMAYAEKSYRDESIRRAEDTKKEIDFINSDKYREERRQSENNVRKVAINDAELDKLVTDTRKFREQLWDEQAQKRKLWIEGPVSTGIEKAEEYKKTHLRRAKQKRLKIVEAAQEATLVKEKAREEAEARLQYGELLKEFREKLKHLGWDEQQKYNDVRNWLNRPLDEHIRKEDYEEALEHVERLKEIPLFNLASWLKAKVELKALEVKNQIRKRKEKST